MQFHQSAGRNLWLLLTTLTLCLSILSFPAPADAQTGDLAAMKKQASQFLEQNNFIDALPILEKLAIAEPDDADTQFYLGYCLVAQSVNTKDENTRRQLRVRARGLFVKAKLLGRNDQLVNALIESILPDGSEKAKFSENKEAESLMEQGEAAFTRGKNDEALDLYKKALELDPKLYYAALFIGDVYKQKEDYANAEIWYQKAIAIDPLVETAYRYSATPLMKQGRYEEARDRYVEAYITAPLNRLAVGGIGQWAQVTGKNLAHPKIDIPTAVEKSKDGNMTITLGADDRKDDGSFAWTMYGISRAAWQLEKDGKPSDYFRKAYPGEAAYRHSLAEEFEALKMVAAAVKKDSKVKTLNPSLAKLVELHDKGLLEAYILLARLDNGIAEDYLPYLQTNRAKLRRYVVEYVIGDK